MKGGIYSDEKCPVCGSALKDNHRDGVSCPDHPQVKAVRVKVKFSNICKRFDNYRAADIFLNGLRHETNRNTFDERNYHKDNPLSFTNAAGRYLKNRKPFIKETSYRSMANHFDKAQAYFQNRNVKELRYADFEDFLETLPQGNKTKKNIMTSIIAMYGRVSEVRIKDVLESVGEVVKFPITDNVPTKI